MHQQFLQKETHNYQDILKEIFSIPLFGTNNFKMGFDITQNVSEQVILSWKYNSLVKSLNLFNLQHTCSFLTLKKNKILFIYLFLDRGEQREKERERNISVWLPLNHPLLGTWPATQACALTGNRTGNPLVCRPVLNPLSHSSQGLFLIFNELLDVNGWHRSFHFSRFLFLCFALETYLNYTE